MNEHELKNGALLDTRTTEERLMDFKFEEIVATANPVLWVEKNKDEWRKFPIFSQNGSGSCVAQTQAKEMGILRWLKDGIYVHFSASDIYQKRENKPSAGMQGADVRNIAKKSGATLEILSPSQNMSDAQMDAVVVADYKKQIGEVFKICNYVELPVGDMETVASVIQTTNKGVMVWFNFKYNEWTDKPEIKNSTLGVRDAGVIRHSVTAVDYCLVNGKKCLIIEDSWGPNFGLNGQRIITEDFFTKRNFYSSYLTQFKFDEATTLKPSYTFLNKLEFGESGSEVTRLQDALRYLGHFPVNSASTGFYGAVTSKAVLEFQKRYNIDTVENLSALGGRIFGPKSIQKMNELIN